MDGFTAVLIVWLGTLAIAFTIGRTVPLQEVINDCSAKGEVTLRSTVIQCKPVAVLVAGKRQVIAQ